MSANPEDIATKGDLGKLRKKLNKDMRELLAEFAERMEYAARPLKSQPGPPRIGRKYEPLALYLRGRHSPTKVLGFDQIEAIIRSDLPPSAREYREWWANDGYHTQARAWMSAGWRVDRIDLPGRTVRFRKTFDLNA